MLCPFPFDLEYSNVVDIDDAGGGGRGDGKRGVMVNTWKVEAKVVTRVRS